MFRQRSVLRHIKNKKVVYVKQKKRIYNYFNGVIRQTAKILIVAFLGIKRH